MPKHSTYKHPNLMYAIVCLFILTLAYWASYNTPNTEVSNTPVFCRNAPESTIEVCVHLDFYLDSLAPNWMYE